MSNGDIIGFIGLGNMGGPMCERLLAAGHQVIAFDLDDAKVAHAAAHGARPAESAADCAARADVLLTSLPRPDHVEAVMVTAGALAALRAGSLWVDLTTNRKELVARLAAEAPPGVDVVDSPVTGAVDGARNGRLTLFIGGAEAPVARATAIIEELGTVIRVRSARHRQCRQARHQPALVRRRSSPGRRVRPRHVPRRRTVDAVPRHHRVGG